MSAGADPSVESDWVGRLAAAITSKTVLVCVGNVLAGDDGLGPAVADALAGTVPWPIVDAENAPENFLMKIVALEPDTVLLVDALECGEPPGTIRLLEARDLTGSGPSTHGPTPMVFLEMLTRIHPCRPLLLGVQPACLDPDAALSAPVRAAVVRITCELRRLAAE